MSGATPKAPPALRHYAAPMFRTDAPRPPAFDWRGCEVQVRPGCDTTQQEADDVAAALALATVQRDATLALLVAAHDRVAALERELEHVTARIPPKAPARCLGPGVVRFDPTRGRLWLLNRADRGWSEFGLWFSGWDELFRRYDVVVTGHATDATGPYWTTATRPDTPLPV